MVTIQLLLMIIFAIGVFKLEGSVWHPGMIMTGSWIFMLLFQQLNLVHYAYPVISPELILLQSIYVGVFLFGAVAPVPGLASQAISASDSRPQEGIDLIVVILIIGLIVLSLITGFDIYRTGAAVLDIRQIRMDIWEQQDVYSHDLASFTKALTRPMVMALVIMAPSFRHGIPRIAAWIGFLVAGVGESLLAGGRFNLGICMVGWTISYLLNIMRRSTSLNQLVAGRQRTKMSALGKIMLPLGAVVSLYLCFGVFPSIRNPDLIDKEDYYLSLQTGESKISPECRNLSRRTGLESIAVFAYGTHYMTSSMMRSDYLLHNANVGEWLFLGGNNFPQFSKLRTMLLGGRTSEQAAKERIADTQPFGKNPWIGGVIDVVIDFGYFGGAVFMFIYGVTCGMVYRGYQRGGQPEILAAASILSISLIAFPYTSLIRTSAGTNTLIVCLFASLLRAGIGNVRISILSRA